MSLAHENDYEKSIRLMPTEWSTLHYMSDVKPLDESDVPCLLEIRKVLEKHGRLDRLGVTLLHRHFEIGDDEIMIEDIDFGARTLTIHPQKKDDAGVCVETSWKLDADESVLACAKNHCYSTCIQQEKEFRELMESNKEIGQSE